MRMHVLAAAAAAVFIGAPAAATPVISGKYIITIRKFCEPTFTVHNSNVTNAGAFVDGVYLGGSSFKNTLLLATFVPAKGSASFGGFTDSGDVAMMQYTGVTNGSSGTPISESPNSGKTSYANTDTTVSFGGQVYNAFYGTVDKNGIAHYVAYQAAYTNESGVPCSEQGELSRQ
jgi:hypothetical protein